ncbi:MAG: hypothetical protein ACOZBL_04495 [Patescibacteria group bacterium]
MRIQWTSSWQSLCSESTLPFPGGTLTCVAKFGLKPKLWEDSAASLCGVEPS